MFWAKSCEMTGMLAPEKDMADPRGFEMEFGEWCMRATLDIIGYARIHFQLFTLANVHAVLLVLDAILALSRTRTTSS